MNLNNINRNDLFQELLELGKKDIHTMMDKVHDILLLGGVEVLSPDRSKDEIITGLNQIMKWFEQNEKYEQCNTIKKIINECLELM
jgi:hypothetical protein